MSDIPSIPEPAVSVRRRLALLVALTLVGFLLVGWVTLRQARIELQRDLENSLHLLEKHYLAVLGHWDRSFRFAATQSLKGTLTGDSATAKNMVAVLRDLQPNLLEVAVVLPNGDALYGQHSEVKDIFAGFADASPQQDLQLSRAYSSGNGRDWRVALRYPISAHDGSLGAYLVGTVSVREFSMSPVTSRITDGVVMGMLRNDAFLIGRWPLPAEEHAWHIFGSGRPGALRQYLYGHPLQRSGYIEGLNSVENRNFVHAFVRLSGYPLTLTVGAPTSTLYAHSWAGMASALTVIAALAAYAVFLSLPYLRFRAQRFESAQPVPIEHQPYEVLFSQLSFGVATHAANGSLQFCNPEAQRLLGLTRAQMLGSVPIDPSWSLIGEDGQRLPAQEYPLLQVLRSGAAMSAKLVGVRGPGIEGTRWLMGDAIPILDILGKLQQVVMTFMDVSEHHRIEVANRLTEQRYRDLVQASLHAVVQFMPSGSLQFLNQAALKLFDVEIDAVGQKIISQLVDVHDVRYQQLTRILEERGRASGDVTLLRFGRLRFEGQVSLNAQDDGHGNVTITMMALDISERQKVLNALRASEERFKGIIDSAMDAIICIDQDHRVLIFNDSAQRMFGYSAEEMVGQPLDCLLPSAVREVHRGHIARFVETGMTNRQMGPVSELVAIRRDGSNFPIEASISQVHAQGQHLMTVIVRDVTSRVEAQRAVEASAREVARANAQLERMAHFDMLTSLPNRVLLADRLRQAMLHCQRRGNFLAIGFLDIDGFKNVNDSLGHAAGDQLLIMLSHRMKLALRNEDTLARIGGDEFVVLIGDLETADECEPVLQRLLESTSEALSIGGQLLQVSCSIGVTIYPRDGAEADILLRHADQAMYQAKDDGKARFKLFDVAQEERKVARLGEVEAIRQGLQRQEFRLYYQPKVNLLSGAVVGCEALIRWQHPQKGLMPPGLFLPLIEDDPINIAIGEWVIEKAIQQMLEWAASGLQMPVSVNVGAGQLQSEGFTDFVAGCLVRYPLLTRDFLEFEVLETSALEDISRVSHVMQELRELGIRFALDDFGTGYSSLTYLKGLPAQQLKVDQSFVRDMLVDADDRAIVRGVVSLAHAFDLEVIAEGVESASHGTELLAMGCNLAQGYGIARPMPPDQLPNWVQRWKADTLRTADSVSPHV